MIFLCPSGAPELPACHSFLASMLQSVDGTQKLSWANLFEMSFFVLFLWDLQTHLGRSLHLAARVPPREVETTSSSWPQRPAGSGASCCTSWVNYRPWTTFALGLLPTSASASHVAHVEQHGGWKCILSHPLVRDLHGSSVEPAGWPREIWHNQPWVFGVCVCVCECAAARHAKLVFECCFFLTWGYLFARLCTCFDMHFGMYFENTMFKHCSWGFFFLSSHWFALTHKMPSCWDTCRAIVMKCVCVCGKLPSLAEPCAVAALILAYPLATSYFHWWVDWVKQLWVGYKSWDNVCITNSHMRSRTS